MTVLQPFQFASTKVAVWAARNPTAVRMAMLLVPFAVAVITALVANTPVYASPSPPGGGCTGG
jgi:hypothetical protein